MVARSFVGNTVGCYLKRRGADTSEYTEMGLKIAGKLSYDDVNELSKYIGETDLRKKMHDETTVPWLRKKGFEI